MDHDLDIEQPSQLHHWLVAQGHLDAQSPPPAMTTLAGGVSNETVLVNFDDGRAWVIKQALAKLRVAVDWYSDPARIHREALGLRWLEKLAPPGAITPLVFEDHTHHLLGMQAVPLPHENWKDVLLAGRVSDDHVAQFGHLLGSIHKLSHERREELAPVFADRSFFESLRLEPYYTYTASQIEGSSPHASRAIRRLCDDTLANSHTLVHGDYSPKNVLIHQGRLILLDHEVIHWGDPAFDIGFAMAHLFSKAHHLPEHRQHFASAIDRFWQTYNHALGKPSFFHGLEARAVRHTLACLLARVAGRSPLPYLSTQEKLRQRDVTCMLLAQPVLTFAPLIEAFMHGLRHHEQLAGHAE